MRRAAALIVVGGLLALAPAALAPSALAQEAPREKFDVRVFAPVGAPGYPASSLVSTAGEVFVGSYASPTCCEGPSKVFRWDDAGALTGEWTVQGQDPEALNGVQVATDDRQGRLYLLDKLGASATVLDPTTGEQTPYASFADVPPCGDGVEVPCSETQSDEPPQPNFAAWGPDGSLYVTDFLQALVWRVPPRGGAAEVWFSDPRLDGVQFGPTGIVLRPDRASFLLGVFAGRPGPDSLGTGALYTVPLQPDGAAGELEQQWESEPGDGVDGFAVGASGHVYVALLGPTANEVVELDLDRNRVATVPATPLANLQQEVPFDAPSSVSFLGERLIVTNHAVLSGDTENMVLFDIFAGETGQPRFVPASAGPLAAAPSAAPSPAPVPPSGAAPGAEAPSSTGRPAVAVSSTRALPATGAPPLATSALLLLLGVGIAARRHRSA